MTSFNLLADTVSTIRNGQLAFMKEVNVPSSSFIFNFLSTLESEGYIEGIIVRELRKEVRRIFIKLKYYRDKGVISDVRVISKPSRRVYWSVNEFADFYNGLGLFILSTSRGILPAYKASKINLGGEVLCAIF